jgi:hypothetical protein
MRQERSPLAHQAGNREATSDIREFALQPFKPSAGCLALRKLMAHEIKSYKLFSARKSVNECVTTHGT